MAHNGDDHPEAVAEGGPMDGSVLGVADTEEFEVVMADRTRWRYIVTDRVSDGPEPARIYVCVGRF